MRCRNEGRALSAQRERKCFACWAFRTTSRNEGRALSAQRVEHREDGKWKGDLAAMKAGRCQPSELVDHLQGHQGLVGAAMKAGRCQPSEWRVHGKRHIKGSSRNEGRALSAQRGRRSRSPGGTWPCRNEGRALSAQRGLRSSPRSPIDSACRNEGRALSAQRDRSAAGIPPGGSWPQ